MESWLLVNSIGTYFQRSWDLPGPGFTVGSVANENTDKVFAHIGLKSDRFTKLQ